MTDLSKIQISKLTEMQHKADVYRGMIIGFSPSLENKLNQFISEYFVHDQSKRNKFVAAFFSTNGLNFRHKQKTFIHILKSDETFSLFLKKNPDFIKSLDKIVSNRNDMAHSNLHSTIENIDAFDGNNFLLHCYKSNKQEISVSKNLKINFSHLQAETDKIMNFNVKIGEILKHMKS